MFSAGKLAGLVVCLGLRVFGQTTICVAIEEAHFYFGSYPQLAGGWLLSLSSNALIACYATSLMMMSDH